MSPPQVALAAAAAVLCMAQCSTACLYFKSKDFRARAKADLVPNKAPPGCKDDIETYTNNSASVPTGGNTRSAARLCRWLMVPRFHCSKVCRAQCPDYGTVAKVVCHKLRYEKDGKAPEQIHFGCTCNYDGAKNCTVAEERWDKVEAEYYDECLKREPATGAATTTTTAPATVGSSTAAKESTEAVPAATDGEEATSEAANTAVADVQQDIQD